jgi:hypothetical protein
MSFIAAFTLGSGDQHLDNRVAVFVHGIVERVAQVLGDVGLVQECVVELHFGDVAEDDVVDHRFNLLDRIRKFVKRGFDPFGQHFVLDGDGDLHKDVVLRLGFHLHVELQHLHAHSPHHIFDERRFPVEPRPRNPREFAQALDDGNFGGLHGEEGAEDCAEN